MQLCVELLDHAETPELALVAVPVPVVVSIFRGQGASAEGVLDTHAFDDLYRKRQGAMPTRGLAGLVAQVELRGRCVGHLGHGAEVVVHTIQEIGFDAAGEVEKEMAWAAAAVGISSPQQAADAVAEKVGRLNGVDPGQGRRAANRDAVAPAISRTVDPQADFAIGDIEQVRQAIAVHVREQHASGIKIEWQSARDLSCDTRRPLAATEVGPVVETALMDDGDVLQSVA